jgi:hypothetical protein
VVAADMERQSSPRTATADLTTLIIFVVSCGGSLRVDIT